MPGGRQIRPTLPRPESARPHNGGGNSGLTTHSELTSGRNGFPTATRGSTAAICLRSTDRSSPTRDCHREELLLMGHNDCFEAGRFTSLQSSWTASRCSRKWMSGPATPWTQPLTGRQKQIVTATRTARRALQEPSVKCKERCFFLDKPLSWMSLASR